MKPPGRRLHPRARFEAVRAPLPPSGVQRPRTVRLERLSLREGASPDRRRAEQLIPLTGAPTDPGNRARSGAVLASGSVLSGTHVVEALLGEGPIGRVYRCADVKIEVPVTLKTLRPQHVGRPEVLAGFHRRTSNSARLRGDPHWLDPRRGHGTRRRPVFRARLFGRT